MLFYGTLSKYITIFSISIVYSTILVVFTYNKTGEYAELLYNEKLIVELTNERNKCKKFIENSREINTMSDNDINEWVQSNGGFRE